MMRRFNCSSITRYREPNSASLQNNIQSFLRLYQERLAHLRLISIKEPCETVIATSLWKWVCYDLYTTNRLKEQCLSLMIILVVLKQHRTLQHRLVDCYYDT